MNQQQIRYVSKRANEILSQKQKDIREKHTTKAVQIDVKDKLKALETGTFTINKTPLDKGYGWQSCIVFPGEVLGDTDREAITKDTQKLQEIFNKLMDELILGDNEVAMKLLKELETYA